MKRLLLVMTAALIASGAVSLAEETPKAKPAEPAAAATPSAASATKLDPALEKNIRGLIRQLGDDKYDKRQAASAALKEIGRPAMPLLTEAMTKSGDPEIRTRAEAIIGEIRIGSTEKLIETIVIAEVNFENITLAQFLEFLTKETQRGGDPESGVVFRLGNQRYAAVRLPALKLQEVKLSDVLKKALSPRALGYEITPDGAVVVRPGAPASSRPIRQGR